MLNPTERELVRAAARHGDDSIAQVVADSLSERGQLLGEFMHAAMLPRRDLQRERELLEGLTPTLGGAGLKWADRLAFSRGLPVAARSDALRFFRLANEQTRQWPLEELWLEGSEIGSFFAALSSPVFEHISRLTLDGSIRSPYTMFVSGAPETLRPLTALRWLRPLEGELPAHWVPIFLPAFAAVEVLCVGPGVELGTWLEVMPRLKAFEVRLTELPVEGWTRELLEFAARRRVKVLVNGLEVTSFDELISRGLLRSTLEPFERSDPSVPPLDDASPSRAAGGFVESFDGRTLRLVGPQGDSWTRFNWRREVHWQLEQVLALPPIHGVVRVVRALANPLRTEVTFGHALKILEVPPEEAGRRVAELTAALRALQARGVMVPALTRDMLYRRGDELEVFAVSDLGVIEPWPSAERLIGLPLLPEHRGTARGLELLVASVASEWTHGQPPAPVSLDELSLRRAWRQFGA